MWSCCQEETIHSALYNCSLLSLWPTVVNTTKLSDYVSLVSKKAIYVLAREMELPTIKRTLSAKPGLAILNFWQGAVEIALRGGAIVS